MTAASDAKGRAAEIHADACLEKPFDLLSLQTVVRTSLVR